MKGALTLQHVQLYYCDAAAGVLRWALYTGRILSGPDNTMKAQCLREYMARPSVPAGWAEKQMDGCLEHLPGVVMRPPKASLAGDFGYSAGDFTQDGDSEESGTLLEEEFDIKLGEIPPTLIHAWGLAAADRVRTRRDIETAATLVRKSLAESGFIMHHFHALVMKLSHAQLASVVCAGKTEALDSQMHFKVSAEAQPAPFQQTVQNLPGSDLPAWMQPGSATADVASGHAQMGLGQVTAAFLCLESRRRVKPAKRSLDVEMAREASSPAGSPQSQARTQVGCDETRCVYLLSSHSMFAGKEEAQ